jgi:hypothetical protein
MVSNATFNNISDISWQSVLLVEEIRVPAEIDPPAAITDKLYHIMLYWIHLPWAGSRTHNVSGDSHWFRKLKRWTTQRPPVKDEPSSWDGCEFSWITFDATMKMLSYITRHICSPVI